MSLKSHEHNGLNSLTLSQLVSLIQLENGLHQPLQWTGYRNVLQEMWSLKYHLDF